MCWETLICPRLCDWSRLGEGNSSYPNKIKGCVLGICIVDVVVVVVIVVVVIIVVVIVIVMSSSLVTSLFFLVLLLNEM
jgi:hypothetical protein